MNSEQDKKRIGPFVDKRLVPFRDFAVYVIGAFLTMDKLMCGSSDHMVVCICALVGECLRLGWPLDYIVNAMQMIPRRHKSSFVTEVRRLARDINKFGFGAHEIGLLQAYVQGDDTLQRVFECMAKAQTPSQDREDLYFTRLLTRFILNHFMR